MKDQKCEIFLIELGEDNAPVHARFRPMNVSPVAVRFDLRSRVPGLMRAEVTDMQGRLLADIGEGARLTTDPRLDSAHQAPLLDLLTSRSVQVAVPVISNGRQVGRLLQAGVWLACGTHALVLSGSGSRRGRPARTGAGAPPSRSLLPGTRRLSAAAASRERPGIGVRSSGLSVGEHR